MRGKDLNGFKATVFETMEHTLEGYSLEIRSVCCGIDKNLLVEKKLPKREFEEIEH